MLRTIPRRARAVCCSGVFVFACGGDPPAVVDASSSGPGGPETTSHDSSGAEGATGTSTASTDADASTHADETTTDASSSSSGGAETGECGDGVLDPGEVCDDGNTVNGDGCDCPTDGAVWSYLGDEEAQILALRAASDGTVIAIGQHRDSGTPTLWSFAADGTQLDLDASIFADGGEVELNDIDIDASGRWSIFGTGTNDGLGWLYRIDGEDVSKRSYPTQGIASGTVSTMGTAIAPPGAVAWLDATDDLAWQVETNFVTSLLYDEDDNTVVALTNSSAIGAVPTVYRFDLEGTVVGTPVELPDYGSTGLAEVGDGFAFFGSSDSATRLHRYDASFDELWVYEDPGVDWHAVGSVGDTTVVAGKNLEDELGQPYMLQLDQDGRVMSTFAPDLANVDMDAGLFFDLDVAEDGVVHLGGWVNDLHSVGQPLVFPYVVKVAL